MARIATDPNYTTPTFPRATAATDLFKKEDVQALAAAMSTHRHNGTTNGLGIDPPSASISGGVLTANSVNGNTLQDLSVTGAKIGTSEISTSKIAPGAVTNSTLAAGSITGDKINPSAFPYTAFVPTATQGATALTVSNLNSGYQTMGLFRMVLASVQFTSAGTAGGRLSVRIPAAVAAVNNGILVVHSGTFIYTQASGVWHHGVCVFQNGVDVQFVSANGITGDYFGTVPNITVASGDRLGMMLYLYQ